MKDSIDRLNENVEQLIGELHQMKLEVQTMSGRLDTGLGALEERLEIVEKQTAEIGSGLAVVLNRSQENRIELADNKKKLGGSLPELPGSTDGSRNWRRAWPSSARSSSQTPAA